HLLRPHGPRGLNNTVHLTGAWHGVDSRTTVVAPGQVQRLVRLGLVSFWPTQLSLPRLVAGCQTEELAVSGLTIKEPFLHPIGAMTFHTGGCQTCLGCDLLRRLGHLPDSAVDKF